MALSSTGQTSRALFDSDHMSDIMGFQDPTGTGGKRISDHASIAQLSKVRPKDQFTAPFAPLTY
jgi:hypothetical protein